VVGEAKTVLKAIYLGSCLLNGVLGLDAASGVHPAGAECAAVGTAVFEADGETVTAAAAAGAQVYADRVFAQFIPDVMRIDTSVASSYLTLCGSPLDSKQLLCGGRKLNDDVIDVTYAYLIAGANVTKGPPNDGVDDSNNSLNFEEGDPTNTQQGHPAVSDTFPYGAAPL
jgi:hypothetical protein